MKNLMTKVSSLIPKLALSSGKQAMNTACMIWFYQPKIPDQMNKYNKIQNHKSK